MTPQDDAHDPDAGVDPDSTGAASGRLLERLGTREPKSSRYKLEGEVARGGMGAILRVWDEDLRRHLAMKVVLGSAKSAGEPGTSAVDGRVLARFLEEAQVTGQLDHPGIVPVHELGLDAEGRVYFTMKLVKGRDLKAIFDLVFRSAENWNQTRALGVILKACEAMAYAHKKGVIHRDLKPANVMVGNFGEVFVMDWGLARVLGRKDAHDIRLAPEFTTSLASVKTQRRDDREEAADSPIMTMDGDVMGTPAYMPPEQAQGEIDKLSSRSDVYSIGAMLYHLLAKQMPYVSPNARISNRTVLAMVLNGPPKPVTEINKHVPAELVAICEKAMARKAGDRYPDTLALAEDLRAYLEHRVVTAYETGAVAELKKWVSRNRGLATSITAAAGLLVVGVVVSSSLYVKAEDKATEAEVERKIAKQRADDVLSLSAIPNLQGLVARADRLWPASPEKLPAIEAWLVDARALLDGKPGDPAAGIKGRPGLEDHRRKLAELEARALPQSEQERDAERASHPRAEELRRKKALLAWKSRMLGKSRRPSEEEVKKEFAKAPPPSDPKELNRLAWDLVGPDAIVKDEVKALLFARQAVETASPADRPADRDTLAWALYRNGRFDEAREEERRAVGEAPEEKREDYKGYLAELEKDLELWSSDGWRERHEQDCDRLSAEIPGIAREVQLRRAWTFPDDDEDWWHAQLAKLVLDLEAFADPATGLCSGGISPEHGWGVERRLEFARTLEEKTLGGIEAKKRWDQAIAGIGDRALSPKYEGLVIEAQLGLLPIGRDAESGLWEFADLATGDPAERDKDGRLVMTEATGLAFVLVPGGKFAMGAQSEDPTGPNFDPDAAEDESPVGEVTLSPFFLSKYEMTQAQWKRLTGATPSMYGPGNYATTWNADGRPADLLHPVESVSWKDCTDALARVNLTLPTEAQWEYAGRAGSTSVYWSGDDLGSLEGVANINDSYGKYHGNEHYKEWEESIDDGETVHGSVGRYRANPFGLFDVHGNVFEWCRDDYDPNAYALAARGGDGERSGKPFATTSRVIRGGSFASLGLFARSSARRFEDSNRRANGIGLRPARKLSAR